MRRRFGLFAQQYLFLATDVQRMVNVHWWRWPWIPFTLPFSVVVSYRVSRSFYLLLGPVWGALRFALSPLAFILRPWMGNCEIHYRAQIGPGLKILHPSLGLVVSAHTVAGSGLTLTGGNCIGGRRPLEDGDICIGDGVSLGANAVLLGPARVGDRVTVGAGAVVVSDAVSGQVLVGVPAREIVRSAGSPR